MGTLCSHAQYQCTDSSSCVVASVYTGTLGGPKVRTDSSVAITGMFSLRAGGTITWSPSRWFTVFALAAGDLDQGAVVIPYSLYSLKIRPNKATVIMFGKIASPMTEIRPIPTTGAGQFEPWTLARIPGSALGGKITISPTEHLSFVAGNFWRGTEASYEIGARYGKFSAAGYFLNCSKRFGGAFDVRLKGFRTALVYNHEQHLGMFNLLDIPRVPGFAIYSDVGFVPTSWKMLRGEWGFIQRASFGSTHVLLGAGYAHEIQSVKGYIFLHI